MGNAIEHLDALIADTLSAWNLYTTLIALVLVSFVAYPLIYGDEPDTHPLLLARQASASPIRHPHESAVYRSTEVPHGYALKSGLSVREPGAPKWSTGKDGDLRDIWREAVGPLSSATDNLSKAKILSLRGKDTPIDHDFTDISKTINAIGSHLNNAAVQRVAIYLPNSIEYIATIFACAFYGLSPVLLPYNQPHDRVHEFLRDTGADCIIASAASLPPLDLARNVPSLRHIVWFVESTSRHMDWEGAPDDTDAKLSVSVWHNILEESSVSSELPANDQGIVPGNVITLWQDKPDGPAQVVEFTQKNMVAGIAALISALPVRQRLNPSDLVLPADSFSHSYVLCLTLAAIFSHSSVAINSVAGQGVDLSLASRGVAPTVIIASNETLASMHTTRMASLSSGIQKLVHSNQASALTAGRMPTDGLLSKLFNSSSEAIGTSPGKLRLILSSERAGVQSPFQASSSAALRDLRVLTGARICYALTAASVAGAVAQTNIYDYRHDGKARNSHFGAPVSSVEVKLVDKDDSKVDGSNPSGEIVVIGPAVAGGKTHLNVRGTFREDCTLAFA